MDGELDVVGEFEPDDFQQVPGTIGSDGEDLGRVGIGLEVDDGEGMVQGMEDGGFVDAVLVGGPMNLHISIS